MQGSNASAVNAPGTKQRMRINILSTFFRSVENLVGNSGLVDSLVPIIAGYAYEEKFDDELLAEFKRGQTSAGNHHYWNYYCSEQGYAFLKKAAQLGCPNSLNYILTQWSDSFFKINDMWSLSGEKGKVLSEALVLAAAGNQWLGVNALINKYPNMVLMCPLDMDRRVDSQIIYYWLQTLQDINQKDQNDLTVLMKAAIYGRDRVVKLLLQHPQIDPTIANEKLDEVLVAMPSARKTALAYAIKRGANPLIADGSLQCIKLFLQHYFVFCERPCYQKKYENDYLYTLKENYLFAEEKVAQQNAQAAGEAQKYAPVLALFACFRKAREENNLFSRTWKMYAGDKPSLIEKVIAMIQYFQKESFWNRMIRLALKALDPASELLANLNAQRRSSPQEISAEEIVTILQTFTEQNASYKQTKPDSTFRALLFWIEAKLREAIWLKPIPRPQVMLEAQPAVDAKTISVRVRELTATETVNAAAERAATATATAAAASTAAAAVAVAPAAAPAQSMTASPSSSRRLAY
jgi:hypothetical protein